MNTDHNQSLGINSKRKGALMALIPLLEITEIREFRITSRSVSLSDNASPITSDVPKPLCCISCTVSLRESLCWKYTTAETEPLPLFHNLDVMISSYSRTETARSHSHHRGIGLSFFFSNTLYFSLLYLIQIQSFYTTSVYK
jgi:hypothetical protein